MLAGASYVDLWWSYGVSIQTLYKVLHKVVDFIHEKLNNIIFPLDMLKNLRTSLWVSKIECRNPLYGCVGAIDGLAIKIAKPLCPTARDFFNRKVLQPKLAGNV